MAQKRIPAIDYLKFIAVFLVMNSHMSICYPRFDFLATGGAIGDALFFFASGFTLFLGKTDVRFDQWYKRRINRIYPSVIATAIVAYAVWHFEENIGDILLGRRYWFLGCIMIYYIVVFPIRKIRDEKKVYGLFLFWLLVMILSFFLIWKGSAALYSKGLYRCLFFFLFMLLGAIVGKHQSEIHYRWWNIPALIVCAALWFYLVQSGTGERILIWSIFPLLVITYLTYSICNAPILTRLYDSRIGGNIVFIISQLCLEVYLIQKFIITDEFNHLFPLNILLIMLVIILAAYGVKMLAEFISQTFRSEPYDWERLILYKRDCCAPKNLDINQEDYAKAKGDDMHSNDNQGRPGL